MGDLPLETVERPPEKPPKDTTKDKKMRLSDWIFIIVCLLLVAGVFVFRFWWKNTYFGVIVNGSSMQQTLQHADELYVRYISEDKPMQRGDVIVVSTAAYDKTPSYLIKRLIAIEGDKVRCRDGQVEICYAGTDAYVALDEPYAYYGSYQMEYDFAEYVVGEDEIFFLGDNRSSHGSSKDSRYQENLSNLKDSLYKETDVCGVVPDWSIRYKSVCKIFINEKNKT